MIANLLNTALPAKSEEEVISNGVAGKKIKDEDTKKLKEIEEDEEIEFIEQPKAKTDVNNFSESAENIKNEQQSKSFKSNSVSKTSSNTSSKLNSSKDNRKGKKDVNKDVPPTPATFNNNKDEVIVRYEYSYLTPGKMISMFMKGQDFSFLHRENETQVTHIYSRQIHFP